MSDHKELYEYRTRLLAKIISASQEFCTLCRQVKDPFTPLDGDGWNVHQIAAHVRDVDQHVYGIRLRRAVNEEHPVFQNFDTTAWIRDNYDSKESLDKILGEFSNSIHELVDWLDGLPTQVWSRQTRHEVYGEFAMQAWAERGLAHILEHVNSIKGDR